MLVTLALLTSCTSAPPEVSAAQLKSNSKASASNAAGDDARAAGSPARASLSAATTDGGHVDALTAVAEVAEVVAYSQPDAGSAVVASLDIDPSYPQYFLATSTFAEHEASADPGWLEVLLPIRPNGITGWIRTDEVVLYQNRFKIEIDVSDHSLTLLENGQPLFTTPIGVGTGDTPTPIGTFYTTVLYDVPDPVGPYGPFAFALSGFSEVLESFNGGDGLIGLHGTNDPSSLGSDVSHGCIRIPNELITQMAESVPLGTPVEIVL